MAHDFAFAEVVKKAVDLMDRGFEVHQKYSCAGCGTRLTIEEPNVFHEFGTCDKCEALTDIRRRGCNYMVVARRAKQTAS
jgi:hypothetical protein